MLASLGCRLERIERERGADRDAARRTVARRIGIAPGTVENIARGRKKSVAGWIEAKIKDAAINALEQEMRRLECELAMVRGGGGGVSGDALASAAAALDRARELVNEAKGH
jgi:hypothetical protein